ncbi:hypothetical protein ACMD2_19204 [Ananas comosus]|uniref:Uncharacterized protein n=1 Tax=Ananas comosus TaxID=4615 RepID=A0A199URW4_ANACO|nr:hypothetical protein ACMD2_19204 [Ananas comosus]
MTRAVLEILCLHIEENTLPLFRNLIAFEQTDIMPDDATPLSRRGIVVQQLRCDEEVSTLFTELRKDVVFDFDGEYYLKSMSSALEARYQGRSNRWISVVAKQPLQQSMAGLRSVCGDHRAFLHSSADADRRLVLRKAAVITSSER